MPAVFNCCICSVLRFTHNNLIIINCSWPFITFCSPFILDIAPSTMSSTCRGICRLFSSVIFEDQLILDRGSKSILFFWVQFINWVFLSIFLIFCTRVCTDFGVVFCRASGSLFRRRCLLSILLLSALSRRACKLLLALIDSVVLLRVLFEE